MIFNFKKIVRHSVGILAAGAILFVGASAVFATSITDSNGSPLYPGDSVSGSASQFYSGAAGYWGGETADLYLRFSGDTNNCGHTNGPIYGAGWVAQGYPDSVSVSCSGQTAGVVDTTASYTSYPYVNGAAQTAAGSSVLTVVAKPVASADLTLASPSSMPVPYNSSVTLGVTYSNASGCDLYKSGSLYSGNVGVGNVGVGNLTADTGFSLSCTANSNTTGTPSDSLTVTVAAQAPNLTVSPSLNRTGDVPLGTELVLSGTISNTGGAYSGSNGWEYTANGGANWYSLASAGSGTTVAEHRWTPTTTGGPYSFRLCVNPPAGKSCTGGRVFDYGDTSQNRPNHLFFCTRRFHFESIRLDIHRDCRGNIWSQCAARSKWSMFYSIQHPQ